MKGFLLDTNIFNHLIEGRIERSDLPLEFPVFVTSLQYDEIMNCKDESKRSMLMSLVRTLPDDCVPLETFVVGIARVGTRVGDGMLYQKLLSELNKESKRKNNSNVYDALLGEVAIKAEMVLVTNDRTLARIVKSNGGFARGADKYFLYPK